MAGHPRSWQQSAAPGLCKGRIFVALWRILSPPHSELVGGTWSYGVFVCHLVPILQVFLARSRVKHMKCCCICATPRPKRYPSAETAKYPCILKQVRSNFKGFLCCNRRCCFRLSQNLLFWETHWEAYGEFGKDCGFKHLGPGWFWKTAPHKLARWQGRRPMRQRQWNRACWHMLTYTTCRQTAPAHKAT